MRRPSRLASLHHNVRAAQTKCAGVAAESGRLKAYTGHAAQQWISGLPKKLLYAAFIRTHLFAEDLSKGSLTNALE
jgi:hypothetical protein